MEPLEFLEHVWFKQKQREGYVFLSFKEDESWIDLAFRLGRDEIELPDAALGDIYFCPNIFREGRRRRELVLPSRWLYADLDEIFPYDIAKQHGRVLKPTTSWESSPKRYQALWLLDRALNPEEHDDVNQKLTYQLGADKGGWDITQVLRVPGTLNHKYEEKPEVKLLWTE